MAGEDATPGATPAGGLLASVRRLAATLLAAAQTRLQLFATDLEVEALRLRRLLLLQALAVVFFALVLMLVSALVVLVFWDGHRLLAIGLLAALYAALGAGCLLMARRCAAAPPRPFAATLDELRKDRAGLGS